MAPSAKCWFSFFLLIFSSCCDVSFAKDKEVNLSVYEEGNVLKCSGALLTVAAGEQFVVDVTEHVHYPSSEVRCQKFPNDEFEKNVLTRIKDEGKFFSQPFKVARSNASGWDFKCIYSKSRCNIHHDDGKCFNEDYYEVESVACVARLQLRLPENTNGLETLNRVEQPPGFLSVNGRRVSSGTQPHRFYDGASTKFTCHPPAGAGARVAVTYTPRDGKESVVTPARRAPVSVYMKLRRAHDGARLACRYTGAADGLGLAVTLTVSLRCDTHWRNVLAFRVNGLILADADADADAGDRPRHNTGLHFTYYFHAGERLAVEVVKDNRTYYNVTCFSSNNHVLKLSRRLAQWIPTEMNPLDFDGNLTSISVDTSTSQASTGRDVYCDMLRKRDHSWLRIVLNFVEEQPFYMPFIKGLSMSNILKMHPDAGGRTVIRYHVGNDSLSLQCVTQNGPAEFSYEEAVGTTGGQTTGRTFWLQSGQNDAKVTCPADAAPGVPQTVLNLIRFIKPRDADATAQHTVWVIVVVAVIVVIFAVIMYMAIRYKNRLRLQNNTLNTGHQTSPEGYRGHHNTSPPRLENHSYNAVYYAEPNTVDNLYAKPTPKAKRNKKEPTYAEPTDVIRGAEDVGRPTDEPTYEAAQYAEPTRSSPSDQLHVGEYQNVDTKPRDTRADVTYAQIYHTNNCGNFKTIEMSAYSEIVPQKSRHTIKN